MPLDTDYLDANRPDWRTEPVADVVAWSHELGTLWVDVSWLDFSKWIARHGLRPAIVSAADSADDNIQTAAQHFLDVLLAGKPLSASDSEIRAVVAAAMPAGAARDELVAMAQESAEHWVNIGPPADDAKRTRLIEEAR